MILAFFGWAWREGYISGDTLLELRAIRPPSGSGARAQPEPYRPGELRELRRVLDKRWPQMARDEASHWINRWRDGRSPYSRVRSHAIRCQLDAVISLALYCGLRRSEIFRQQIDWMHDDNAHVMVWDEIGPWDGKVRTVHYTDSARALIAPWCRLRSAIHPEHPRAWLNLHAATTVRQAMRSSAFDRLLVTYLGSGWQLSRLRATCGVGWAKAGLPPEHLRQVLGYSSLSDVWPYLALVGGDIGRRMDRLDSDFQREIGRAA
jgi:integrase